MFNGGDEIIDYAIEMDNNGSGIFTEVKSDATSPTHLQTISSAGFTYKFRVRARNGIGYSNYSTVFSIVSATVPSKPDAPSTFVTNEYEILVSWNLPSDQGGLNVNGYKVEI